MNKNMRDRLIASEKRLQEIDDLLLLEETTRDINKFRDLNIERSELAPIVDKFHEYLYAENNKNDALIMAEDKDPEISEMGKAEVKNVR